MLNKVTVIDYGVGNLLSVCRAFEHNGAEVITTESPIEISNAERLVLPGVGAFADAMQGLRARNLVEPIRHFAKTGKPFMGICLGMQMMLDESEEFGQHEGLGLIPGKVKQISGIDIMGAPHKVPHIGWNQLNLPKGYEVSRWRNTILETLPEGSSVYFVHSFTAVPTNTMHRLADVFYGGHVLSAVVQKGNLYGCQFHPEKSGPIGLKILKNFLSV